MFILKSLTSHYHVLIKTEFQNKQLKYLNVDKIYNLMLRNIEKIHIFNVRSMFDIVCMIIRFVAIVLI